MTQDREDERDEAIDRALRRLGKDVVPLEAAERAEQRRARLVPGLTAFADREFAARKKRSVLRRAAAFAGALTVAAAATFVLVHRGLSVPPLDAEPSASIATTRGQVRIAHGAGPSGVASAAMPLTTSDRVHTEDGTAEVSLRTGASVELGPSTELELAGDKRLSGNVDERVSLSSGRIRVRVPKLGSGQLVVTTPNAAVTVHGTVFTVEVQAAKDGHSAVTRVSVTEGKVSVESSGREIFLSPGTSWSSAPAVEETPAVEVPSDTSTETPARSSGVAKRSTLQEENALFRAALAARRAGNAGRAVELLDDLLRRYPGSPLEPAARKERGFAAELSRATPKKP